jgi:predicted site-specific integrase-resolvase
MVRKMNTYNVSQFAQRVGVSVKTLQRWDRSGRLKPAARSPGNRRLYTEEQLNAVLNRATLRQRVTIAYTRVSRRAQQPALLNQRATLEQFCLKRGLVVDIWVTEIGGGLNFKRPKFTELVDRITRGEIGTLVIAHPDRLARFGYDLLAHLCEVNGCQLVVLNTESLSPAEEVVQDLMTIIHGFSSRLDGLRNYRQVLNQALKQDVTSHAKGTQDTTQSHA